jgi:hypothetical protein
MIEIELLEKYDAVQKRYKSQKYFLRKDHLATVLSNYFGAVKNE